MTVVKWLGVLGIGLWAAVVIALIYLAVCMLCERRRGR
jgi:predicted small integral membrane protein